MTHVALLDYGVGNVGSVRRAFERLGAEVLTTSDPAVAAGASRVVLPGVGAFAPARERLAAHETEEERRRHLESLRRRVARDWESMDFATLQSAIRELVDRLEVDGDETRLFLHL